MTYILIFNLTLSRNYSWSALSRGVRGICWGVRGICCTRRVWWPRGLFSTWRVHFPTFPFFFFFIILLEMTICQTNEFVQSQFLDGVLFFILRYINKMATDGGGGEVNGRARRLQAPGKKPTPVSFVFYFKNWFIRIRISRQIWVICVFSDIVWQCPICHMWLSVTPYICSNFQFWKQKIQAIRSLFPIGVILFLVLLS
jgi:hypothetical protein